MNSAANLPGSAFAGYPPPGFNYYEQSPYQQNPSPGQQTMALPSYAEASSLPVRSVSGQQQNTPTLPLGYAPLYNHFWGNAQSPYHPPPPPPHAQGFNNGAPSQPPQQYTGQAPLSHPPQPASALLSPRTPFSHRGGQPGQGPRNSNRFKPRNARREEGEVSEESGVYTPTSWNSGDANSYTPNPFPLDGAADSPQSSVSQKGYSVAQWQPSLLPAHESPANHHTDQLWKRSAASQPSSPQLPPGLPTLKKPSALSRQLETDDAGHAQSHAVKTSGHQQPQATIQLRDERKWAVDALKWLNSNGVTPEAVFELLQVKPDQVQELCRLVREAGLPVPATLAAAPSAPAAVGSGFTVEQPPCTDASVNGSEVKQDKAPVKVNGSVAKAPLSQESVKSAAQRPVQETPPASLPAKPAKEAMPASLPAKPAKTEGSRQEYIARLQAAKAKKSGIAQEGVSASPVDHRGAEPLLRGSGAQGNGVSQPTAVNGVAKVTTSASSASDVSTPTMSNSDLQTQTSSRVESVSAEDTVPRTTALVSAVPPIPGLFLGGQQSGPASLPSKPVSFTIPVPKTRQQNLAGTATNTKVSELKSQAAPSLSRRSSSFANCRDHQERVVIEVSGDEDSEMEDAPPIKSAGAHTPQQPEPVDLKLKQARIEEEKRQLAKKIAMLEQRRLAKQSATLTIPKKALFSAPMSPAPVDNGVGTSTGAPKPQQSDAGKAMAEVPKLPIDVPKLPVEAPKLPVEIAKPHSIIAEKAPVEVPLAKIDVVAARTKTFPAPEAGASKEFEVSHPPQVIGVKRSASTDANPEVKKKRADILSRMLALQMELAQLGDEPAEATDESPAPPMVTAEVVEEVRRSESVVMQEPIKEVPVSEPAVVQKIVEEVPASEPAVVQKTVETMPVSEPAALQTTVEEASASEPVVVTSSETTPDAAVPSASESELYEPTGSMDTPMEIDDESDSDDAMEISSSESGEIRSPSPVSPAVTAPIPGLPPPAMVDITRSPSVPQELCRAEFTSQVPNHRSNEGAPLPPPPRNTAQVDRSQITNLKFPLPARPELRAHLRTGPEAMVDSKADNAVEHPAPRAPFANFRGRAIGDGPADSTSEYPKPFIPYESPLRAFQGYRNHPDFTQEVAGGFRSLTYSNNIVKRNPDFRKRLCPYECSGGSCNDKDCPYMHFNELSLSDDQILVQLGLPIPGLSDDDRRRWTVELKGLIDQLRTQDVRDTEYVAAKITQFRRDFLGDQSRVLNL